MIRENIPKESGIYQIRNLINGKRYVGSAKSMLVRASRHASALDLGKHHNRHLQAAYDKHGASSFVFEPMLICAKEDLLFYEQRALDTIKDKYNHAPVAGNTLGIPCSTEKRAKISKAHTGKTLTKAHKAAIAEGGRGRRPSEKTRAKLKLAAQRRASDPEWRRKVSEGKTGKTLSEEHRKSMSDARKGKKTNISAEALAARNIKIGEANRTRVITDQHRANASKALRNRKGITKYEYNGAQYSMLELSEMSGLSKNCIKDRMHKHGMSLAEAVETPSRKAKK